MTLYESQAFRRLGESSPGALEITLEITLFRTRTPPIATAPIASSEFSGRPNFRTRQISNGRLSLFAISKATGVPPQGSARTITFGRLAYISPRVICHIS
ncbi:MAG: hypothetical protein MJA27_09880 [Pseudanabaenales cyanobacterium]|nr:hypothetical protein [Pseudanabaenales cyanobacterium]